MVKQRAKFRSMCQGCGNYIQRTQHIGETDRGWMHLPCAEVWKDNERKKREEEANVTV